MMKPFVILIYTIIFSTAYFLFTDQAKKIHFIPKNPVKSKKIHVTSNKLVHSQTSDVAVQNNRSILQIGDCFAAMKDDPKSNITSLTFPITSISAIADAVEKRPENHFDEVRIIAGISALQAMDAYIIDKQNAWDLFLGREPETVKADPAALETVKADLIKLAKVCESKFNPSRIVVYDPVVILDMLDNPEYRGDRFHIKPSAFPVLLKSKPLYQSSIATVE